MSVHITKTYNIGGLIGLRQNAVKNAGETLGFKEMSLFKFPDAYDSDDELHVRMDGIIASLCPEDIVIFQHPSGESPRYDGFLFEHLRRYHGTKIVAFIQEIASDRDDSEYSLSDEITLLNRADMFIFASAALRDYYIANGLKEKPYLIQNIPDYMTDICTNEHKNKKLYIMAETSQNEYPLNNLNIEVVQYDEYRAMESILRLSDGGFGLIWDADEQALGLYMAAGIPVIVKGLIGRLGCADYVHLMGQQKLDDVYKHYDAYVAASQSEGFGLTLMEAIGSGLPIVGFDVRYGNQTFIDDGQNGYKIPITDEMDQKEKIKLLSERIVRMFTEDDMDAFSGHSYEKAKEYLTKEVVHRWIELLK